MFRTIENRKRPLSLTTQRSSWSCWADLNRRPHPYQGCALPTELQQQIDGEEPQAMGLDVTASLKKVATRKGLEPSTSGVTGRRSNQLNYRAKLSGGNNRARTCDPMLVRHVLSQLSYAPDDCGRVTRGTLKQRSLLYRKPPCLSIAFFQIFIFLFQPGSIPPGSVGAGTRDPLGPKGSPLSPPLRGAPVLPWARCASPFRPHPRRA